MQERHQYRLVQEVSAVSLSRTGRPLITQLHVGTVVSVRERAHPDLAPQMVEIESDGGSYALFAADLADRGEPITDE